MMAQVGDWLVPEGDNVRAGLIIGVRNADGSPPYVIKWRSSGHIALVFPGPYARIVPGSTEAGPVSQAATGYPRGPCPWPRHRRPHRAQRCHRHHAAQACIEVIPVSGEELGRGRGGPCGMACPIELDPA